MAVIPILADAGDVRLILISSFHLVALVKFNIIDAEIMVALLIDIRIDFRIIYLKKGTIIIQIMLEIF